MLQSTLDRLNIVNPPSRTLTVIGTVSNHAARLCEESRSRQILVSQRVLAAVESLVESEFVGELTLKGFRRPLPAYEILRWAGRPG